MEFYKQLLELFKKIHDSHRFADILPTLESEILTLFDAQRMTIYQRNRFSRDIVSRFKSGDEIKEIRLPIGPQSLAGYVALSLRPLLLKDAYDDEALKTIHPKLRFAQRYDKATNFRTKSVLIVPIQDNGVLLGVIQFINRKDGTVFTEQNARKAIEMSSLLAQKFRYELGGTKAPFDYLYHLGAVVKEQLELIHNETSFTVQLRKLIEDYKVSKELIGLSLEVYYQVPFLGHDEEKFHVHVANSKLNLNYLQKNNVVVIADVNEEPIILMAEPTNSDLLLEIESATGICNYSICVGIPEDINRYLGTQLPSASNMGEIGDILGEIEEDIMVDDGLGDDDNVNEEAPAVVKLVNRILHDAVQIDASDIHIEPAKGKSPTQVRMRVDGVCQKVIEIPASHQPATAARIKIMSRLDIAEKRLPQDGKFTVKFGGSPIEVRVATIPTVFGEGIVMRILATGGAMPFDKLCLSDGNFKLLSKLIKHPHGILLVVGPTGSGKTTTLHAVLGELNTPEKKIWTAEDPVEITQPGLQQVQMNSRIGLTFETALRAFLRADPDIILIGEMRDKETAHAGVEASLTGHLVLSTLHTNSAPETITRLLDIGLDPINFADAIIGILAQRLIRTLCKSCKEPYKPEQKEVDFIRRHYGEEFIDELNIDWDTLNLHRAVGCPACNNTGYKGRVGIHEVLPISAENRNNIYSSATVSTIAAQGIKDGMRTLVQDGIVKVLIGLTDFKQLQTISTLE
ncbi:MAG: type II secretory ATPase GspE/PulE/Tfp pilus assembly ATPase PilB-like protein [Alteromonadaceae bacterium]|jgi:type II secretory ATPase GspE/PulE/Tfp pilus assembly ATPase PilB-like protein